MPGSAAFIIDTAGGELRSKRASVDAFFFARWRRSAADSAQTASGFSRARKRHNGAFVTESSILSHCSVLSGVVWPWQLKRGGYLCPCGTVLLNVRQHQTKLWPRTSHRRLPFNTIQAHVLKSWNFLILQKDGFWRPTGGVSPQMRARQGDQVEEKEPKQLHPRERPKYRRAERGVQTLPVVAVRATFSASSPVQDAVDLRPVFLDRTDPDARDSEQLASGCRASANHGS